MTERRVRTWWIQRERYRRIGWCAAAAGGLMALVPVVAALREDGSEALSSPHFLIASLVTVGLGVLAPRWAVGALWRRQKQRNALDWS